MAASKYLRENEEMRAHIAQLKKDLEQERNLVKQAHRDKVAEVKRAREEEGVRLRSELESQLEKTRRDARNEKLNMERTFKQQMQLEVLQKAKEKDEEIGRLLEKWNKERKTMEVKATKARTEAMAEANKKFEAERKQLTTELFKLDSARNVAEDRAKTMAEADLEKAEELRKLSDQHRTDLDKIRKEAQNTDGRHREELKNKEKLLASRDREIMRLGEKLSRVESERDQLQDDYDRMKQGESFLKVSPQSPSVGIGDKSFEEVTASTITVKEYTEREKELIVKNGELSFRLKELGKQHQAIKDKKEDLERTVEQIKDSNRPLEERNKKLFQRITEIQGAKQRQESHCTQLKEEITDLQDKIDTLEKVIARQKHSISVLRTQSGPSHDASSNLRKQIEQLKSENKELKTQGERRYSELHQKHDRLQRVHRRLKQKLSDMEKARSPISLEVPNTSLDTSSRSQSITDLATVEEESHTSLLQDELEQATFDFKELETNYTLLEREKLCLEKENDLLKQRLLGGNYDIQRQDAKLESLQQEVLVYQTKVKEMEDEMLAFVQSDEDQEAVKHLQKERARRESEKVQWHELETKLAEAETKATQYEADLNKSKNEVSQLNQREEELLQQLQDMSGELEYAKEQHSTEISHLKKEIKRRDSKVTSAEETDVNLSKMEQEVRDLQQQLQESSAILRRTKDEASVKEEQYHTEVARLNEAIAAADNESATTIEALRLKVSAMELDTAKTNENVFELTREKTSMQASLLQEIAQLKEEVAQARDTSLMEQESWRESFTAELKGQHAITIEELATEHRNAVTGLEDQQTATSTELEENRSQLQQAISAMAEKDKEFVELTNKLSQCEPQLTNVRKILQEAPTIMAQGDIDTTTGRTLNNVIQDLISEVNDGTITVLVSEQVTQSSATKEADDHTNDDAVKMQVQFDQLNQEHSQLKGRYTMVEQQVETVSQERDQIKARHDQLEEQANQLGQERDQIMARNDQLEEQANQLGQERDQIKNRNNQLEEQVNQLSQERDQLKESHNQQEHQIDELQCERQECDQIKDQLEQQINQMRQDQIKQRHDQLVEQNRRLTEENMSLKEELKARDEMAQRKEAQFTEQLAEDNTVLTSVQQQLNHSQQSLQEVLEQVEEKSSLVEANQFQCQALEHQLQEHKTSNQHLQKQHNKLQLEQITVQKRLSETLAALEELKTTLRLKDSQISQLQVQLQQQQNSAPLLHTTHRRSLDQHRLFITLLDYNPQSFCQSGHPEWELQLQAGDIVKVMGDMNADGYYYAQFKDRQGLVPAHFLEEMTVKNNRILKRLHNQSLSSTSVTSNGDISLETSSIGRHHSIGELHPQYLSPPTEVKLERVLQRGLMISWSTPEISALGLSNGITVQGYQIYIDGVLNHNVMGCYQSKTLVSSVDVNQPHILSVATFSVDGKISKKSQVHYKPIHLSNDYPDGSPKYRQRLHPSQHQQHYRLMKVLQSQIIGSASSPTHQLRMQAGDIVKVFGRAAQDGNYLAEIQGRQGFIPPHLLGPLVSEEIV